jgi:NAD(P)H-hydrate repair Nnr-like enzyme with NAD(P)H-hydrate dehydratase domain
MTIHQQSYWQRQVKDKPLYPNILWSRPENRLTAGKLLIVGGNLHGFAAVGQAYQAALKTGVGTARVLLPDSLQKTVGKMIDNCQFTASTPNGSFASQALAEMLDGATWADAVLLAGDFGRSSETAILLERFLSKYSGFLVTQP